MDKRFLIENGELIWKDCYFKKFNGKRAGTLMPDGYRVVKIDNKQKMEHRIIWEILNGQIPDGFEIDHINHIRDDNRIENLRLVNKWQQNTNLSTQKRNKVNFSGITLSRNKYKVVVGKQFGGRFSDLEEAKAKVKELQTKLKYHENHGTNIKKEN